MKVKMGIRSLDTSRKVDYQQFMTIAECLISEVSAIKVELQAIIADQSTHSKKLIEETHTTFESTISVLKSTINRLRHSLSLNFHVP